jgi:hypothetical protein
MNTHPISIPLENGLIERSIVGGLCLCRTVTGQD